MEPMPVPLLTRVPVGITLLDAVVLRCRVLLNSTYLELMIDDYGEIKNKEKGKVTICTY